MATSGDGRIFTTLTDVIRLSCHAFRDNAVRLQLFALAYTCELLPQPRAAR
jgi:hypothetical protein